MFNEVVNKLVVTTYDDKIFSSSQLSTENLSPCNHEEGDYRPVLHAFHMSNNGIKKVMISTVDTDVVVIAVASFLKMNLDELWVSIGVGKSLRYFPIHDIVKTLGMDKSKCLPIFHALTGCDQVSQFASIGKTTA